MLTRCRCQCVRSYRRTGTTLNTIIKPNCKKQVGVLRAVHNAAAFAVSGHRHDKVGQDACVQALECGMTVHHIPRPSFGRRSVAGMTAFKREVFDKIKSKVTAALIAEINRERDGQQVDRGIIKKCVEVYERSGEGNLDLYQIDFDKPLLHATKTYYKEKAVQWIATDNVPTYLDKVEQVLVAEAGRVHACMHESTEAGLLREVEEVLLAEQQSKLLENEGSGLRVLLREEKRDDLSRLYRLYNRLGDRGLDPIATVVREHFQEIGLGIVKDRDVKATGGDRGEGGAGAGAAAGGGKPEKDSPDTPSFVIALLDLHDKARSFVNTEFNGHTKFQKALKDAFEVGAASTTADVRIDVGHVGDCARSRPVLSNGVARIIINIIITLHTFLLPASVVRRCTCRCS